MTRKNAAAITVHPQPSTVQPMIRAGEGRRPFRFRRKGRAKYFSLKVGPRGVRRRIERGSRGKGARARFQAAVEERGFSLLSRPSSRANA